MNLITHNLSQLKQERIRLKIGEQEMVARQLCLDTDTIHVMQTFKVLRQTVFNMKNADEILKFAAASSNPLSTKATRMNLFPGVEERSYDFVLLCHVHRMLVTCSVLQQNA